ncbi:DEAD/DEAH box helicase [Hippea maritima]|uniref:RNA helicase n=1 Tax=Hippea maritima (strain ATCC 700847 / DSM 10411 / MH2) TaxID=760142 RepID=F2LY61_HIPMA|nr:DEAD/DEAH box helicase [Hippea maritima]AEA34384.1 DEAD/DEAH box helicase domain protein [Hippea maritima DSM 10411]
MSSEENFKGLGLSEGILKTLQKQGFEKPTPIQEKVIPLILQSSKDLVAEAPTGTGKTLAFGLPLIDLLKEKTGYVQAVILAPTRELAIQVCDEINAFKGKKRLKAFPIYGGQSIELQKRRLKEGVDIVVGTAGRIIDHINRKTLNLSKIDYFILDEADEMLNMGFIDDIKEILTHTNPTKNMFMFSATMPEEIKRLAKQYMKKPEFVRIEKSKMLTSQIYFEVKEQDKFEALCRIRDAVEDFYGLIFCKTKVDAQNVANKLIDRGYYADAIHGDLSQDKRERILKRFRDKKINMLVATDVAARGIDIDGLTHVINYSMPQDAESYIHRIGRTGRAQKKGIAITFVSPSEYRKLRLIQKLAKAEIKKEKLPSIQQAIEYKKLSVKKAIEDVELNKNDGDYLTMAEELLGQNDAELIIAKLLKLKFSSQLSKNNYKEIEEPKLNRNSMVKLFVALGSQNGYTAKKLADFISKKVEIESNTIRDIRIFDRFSFLSVPAEEAEEILYAFKSQKRGFRPIVSKAKPRTISN